MSKYWYGLTATRILPYRPSQPREYVVSVSEVIYRVGVNLGVVIALSNVVQQRSLVQICELNHILDACM